MRCVLGGYRGPLPPLVLSLTNGVPFEKAGYVALGYTQYDVLVIGACGGKAGSLFNTSDASGTHTDQTIRGGAGGGGGMYRTQGLLADLAASVPVTVGLHGAPGDDVYKLNQTIAPPIIIPFGSDGGYSTFGTIASASGGKGGTSYFDYGGGQTGAGGAGGAGGRTMAGGGAAGGTRPNNALPSASNGADGTWDGTMGKGGGGGCGGYKVVKTGASPSVTIFPITSGGRGSYSALDPSVFALGETVAEVPTAGASNNIPLAGWGGGAKATPLNGQSKSWGGGDPDNPYAYVDGAVILSLT